MGPIKLGYVIQKASHEDIPAIKALADMHKGEIGFVTRPALIESVERGEILIAADTSIEVVGFVHYRHRRDTQTTLYHIVVHQAYQRKGVGRNLVAALRHEADAKGKSVIVLKCPSELPANAFYQSCGFEHRGVEPGKNRPLNVWALFTANLI